MTTQSAESGTPMTDAAQASLRKWECDPRLYAHTSPPPDGWDIARSLERQLAEARSERDALRKDAERWRWSRDILSGDNSKASDRKALYIAAGLMRNETVEQIIDAALSANQSNPSNPANPEEETR